MGVYRAQAARIPAAPGFVLSALVLGSAACGMMPDTAGQFPDLAEYAGSEIADVRFVGTEPFPVDTIADLVDTEATHCRLLGLPFCIPGTDIGRRERHLNLETVRRDVNRVARFYRGSGFYDTEVRPAVEPVDDRVIVSFVVSRGRAIVVDSATVRGTESVVDPDSLERHLPLQRGELFDIGAFRASADTVLELLRMRGHAYAEVLRNYDVEPRAGRATVLFNTLPGPLVRIDSIIVQDGQTLDRSTVLRQLAFGPGDVYRASDLVQSQRNLYDLEIVQLASVSVAPDSLQMAPGDSTTATALVQISESPEHVVEAAVGYGTVDCLRAETRWVSRNFRGGGRRLELIGTAGKIGSAPPLDAGLGSSVCTEMRDDGLFVRRMDYRLAAELQQPAFLSPKNRLTLSAFAEQQTEPDIFQREAQGGRAAVTRRLPFQEVTITGAVDVERGRTVARPVIFCVALRVCRPADINQLARRRWRNMLVFSGEWNRVNDLLNPTDGYRLGSEVDWATSAIGSDITFIRSVGRGSVYKTVRPRWVAAGFVRLGTLFETASLEPGEDFLPPEERFFLGGSSSVRGFGRNQLGPGVYVGLVTERDPETGALRPPEDRDIQFIPTGGAAVAVTSVELRMPAPFGGESLRMALFIDAGALGRDGLDDLDATDWKATPGVGIRVQTPVGPARIDVAYNPYSLDPGPLFLPDPDTGNLIRVADRFTKDPRTFLGRFRVHLAVGQPF